MYVRGLVPCPENKLQIVVDFIRNACIVRIVSTSQTPRLGGWTHTNRSRGAHPRIAARLARLGVRFTPDAPRFFPSVLHSLKPPVSVLPLTRQSTRPRKSAAGYFMR
jgi:hypothetical protein